LYIKSGNDSMAIEILKDGTESGIIYPFFRGAGIFAELEKYEYFNRVLSKNDSLRCAATLAGNPVLDKVGIDKKKHKQPVFIALHGGSENNEIFMKEWSSKKLSKNYLTLYIQSSQVFANNRFWWVDLEKGKADIDSILAGKEFDNNLKNRVITIGGFSHGGRMALYYALNNAIPVKKVIMLCPEIDKDVFLNDAAAAKLKKDKIEIIMITGSEDPSIDQQRAFRDFAKKNGLKMNYIEFDGMGHMFTEEFYKYFDENI